MNSIKLENRMDIIRSKNSKHLILIDYYLILQMK